MRGLVFLLGLLWALGAIADTPPPTTPPPAPRCPPPGTLPTRILWDVPIYQQQTNYTCGASAMQAVLAYYGFEFTEDVLAKAMGSDPKNGTDHHRMAEFANAKGIKAEVKVIDLGVLVERIEKGQPVIVEGQAWIDEKDKGKKWADIWDAGHYMTVIGLDQNNIYFSDPSFPGRRGFVPCEEWVQRWHDLDWKNQKTYYTAIVFDGKPNPLPTFGRIN